MCDTVCVRKDKHVLFAKNSDRNKDEPQYTWYAVHPLEDFDNPHLFEEHAEYRATSWKTLQQAIPQFSHPYPALVSTPSWMWGAEMGINLHGVAIGNEGLFTNDVAPYSKAGLLGMDILRIALHNAATAREARDIIIHLIETFGQGGNGAYKGKLMYHNAFLITDGSETYILETAARAWAWKLVNTSTSISNALSLRCDYDATNQRVSDHRHSSGEKIDFKRCYQDSFYSRFSRGDYRLAMTRAAILSIDDTVPGLRDLCRSHITKEPHAGMKSICIHPDPITRTATTASMVIDYAQTHPRQKTSHPQRCFAWSTCTPYPCSSLYKPFPLPSTPDEVALIQESKLPSDRISAKRFAARASELTPVIALHRKNRQRALPLLRKAESFIDAQTLDWTQSPFKSAIETAEICYTASEEASQQMEEILGVHYDERHNITTA